MYKKIVYIFLFFSCAVSAQEEAPMLQQDQSTIVPLQFDQDEIERFKKDRDFQYEMVVTEPTLIEKAWDWFVRGVNKVLSWIFGNGPANSIIAFVLKILPYLLLGLLLFFILRFFLKVNTRDLINGQSNANTIVLSEADAILNKRDLSKLLDAAIADKNYRLAVRYYYLSILQRLSDKNYIDWHHDKTNEDYITELTQPSLKERFVHSTYLYDFVWYGNFDLDEARFSKARQDFQTLITQIG